MIAKYILIALHKLVRQFTFPKSKEDLRGFLAFVLKCLIRIVRLHSLNTNQYSKYREHNGQITSGLLFTFMNINILSS